MAQRNLEFNHFAFAGGNDMKTEIKKYGIVALLIIVCSAISKISAVA